MQGRNVNFALTALLVAIFSSGSLCCEVYAQASDKTWVSAPAVKGSGNSGKRLALAGTVAKEQKDKEAKEAASDGLSNFLNQAHTTISDQFETHNIPVQLPKLNVPSGVAAPFDDCYKCCKGAVDFFKEHTSQFGGIFARYLKQLVSPPKMTPCASPYLMEDRVIPPA